MEKYKCSICGREYEGFGNNPWPVRKSIDDRCCNECDSHYVIPMRIVLMTHKPKFSPDDVDRLMNEFNKMSANELDAVLSLF